MLFSCVHEIAFYCPRQKLSSFGMSDHACDGMCLEFADTQRSPQRNTIDLKSSYIRCIDHGEERRR